MSAICGIIHFDGKPVDKADLAIMAESSPHRGPDGVSFHFDGNAGFAHLAFHVTPESVHEQQPLISDSGRLMLVADVRLDNREEVALKLGISSDHPQDGRLQTTDDKLLLAAFQRWGQDCVDYLLGDFVFAVWDRKKESLFLARDPLGGYCVYFHQIGQTIIFASEISAILDLPFTEAKINQDRVLRELEFIPKTHEETFFESVHYLAPAHCLLITSLGKRTWKYWDIDPDHRISYTRDDEYSEHLLELIDRAVACRMRSTGPIGISLSGGNDSTLLAASAARQLLSHSACAASQSQSRLLSFSYVFDEYPECDEREYIDPVVDQYDLDAHYIKADSLWSFGNLGQQAIARDRCWSNSFVQFPECISRAAQSSGCKVLIDGQYGDPLFSGSNIILADLLHQGKFAGVARYLRQHSEPGQRLGDLLRKGVLPLLPAWIMSVRVALRPAAGPVFNSGLCPERQARAKQLRRQSIRRETSNGLEPGRKSRYTSLLNPIWPQGRAAVRGLTYGRFGIEPVSPFFDRRIVEFIMALPNDRINSPEKHRLLQYQALKKRLPEKVCERTRKTNFSALLKTGLFKNEKPAVRKLLGNSLALKQRWYKEDWIEEQLTTADTSDLSAHQLTKYLHLELWLRSVAETTERRKKWSEPYYFQD